MKLPAHYEDESMIVSRMTDLLLIQGRQQKELVEHLGLADYLNVSPLYLLRGNSENDTQFENAFLTVLRQLTNTRTTTEIIGLRTINVWKADNMNKIMTI